MNAEASAFLQQYGYAALALGTLLEGETIVIVAGILAQQGVLSAPLVALVAFCGTLTSDQGTFLLGRWKGAALLRRFPRLASRVGKANALMQRHETPLILGFRFLYGLRTVIPIMLGMGHVHYLKYLVLNLLGAAVWAATFTGVGFFFGHAVTRLAERYPYAGYAVPACILAALAGIWLWRRATKRAPQASRKTPENF